MSRNAVLLVALALLAGACEFHKPRRLGPTCLGSGECRAGGVCYRGRCLSVDGDEDRDTLSNGYELGLQMSPLLADSDQDGKTDPSEIGADPSAPADSDGDGLIDAIESAQADPDGDCIADESDPENDTPLPPAENALAVQLACKSEGVCAGQTEAIRWYCQDEAVPDGCDYSQVPGYDVDPILGLSETLCDRLDNDCDGLTDELVGLYTFRCPRAGVCASYDGPDDTLVGVCLPLDWECSTPGPSPCDCSGGMPTCPYALWSCVFPDDLPDYEPGVELTCDALDNDCDGETDEDLFYVEPNDPLGLNPLRLGESCGLGLCAGGTLVCDESGERLHCTGHERIGFELCDGLDNNCDGLTDEIHVTFDPDDAEQKTPLPVGQPCRGLNNCGAGTVECLNPIAAGCSVNPGGSEYPCPFKGICQLLPPGATLYSCATDPPTCDMGVLASIEGLPPYVADEGQSDCDFADNDCDGQQDEGSVLGFVMPGGPADFGEPADRGGAALAFLPGPQRLFLFGGRTRDWTGLSPSHGYLFDLWSAAATTSPTAGDWLPRFVLPEDAASWPTPREGARLAAHPRLSLLYLHGGRGPAADPDDPPVYTASAYRVVAAVPTAPELEPLALVAGDTTPPAVAFHALVVVDGAAPGAGLWVLGGETAPSGTLSDAVVRIDPESGEAFGGAVTGLPARAQHVAVVDGTAPAGRILVFGGRDSAGRVADDTVYAVPLAGGAVEVLPGGGDGPGGRLDPGLALDADGQKLWLFGGRDASGADRADLWWYDLAERRWNAAAALGPSARSEALLFVNAGFLWLRGGRSADGLAARDRWRIALGEAEGGGSAWAEVARIVRPMPRVGAASLPVPATAQWYVFGGTAVTPEGFVPLSDLWRRSFLDSPPAGWTPVETAAPLGLEAVNAVVGYDPVGQRFVGYGGIGRRDGELNADVASDTLWVYELATDRWTVATGGSPDGPPPLRLAAGAYVPTLAGLVVFGGATSEDETPTAGLWLYTPDDGRWTALDPELAAGTERRLPRSTHGAVYDSLRDRLYIIGGANGGGTLGVFHVAENRFEEFATDAVPAGLTLAAFLDHDSGQLLALLVDLDQTLSWVRVSVRDADFGAALPFAGGDVFPPPTPAGSAALYNPVARAAMLFGGVGIDGAASSLFWALTQSCPETVEP